MEGAFVDKMSKLVKVSMALKPKGSSLGELLAAAEISGVATLEGTSLNQASAVTKSWGGFELEGAFADRRCRSICCAGVSNLRPLAVLLPSSCPRPSAA